MSDAIEATGTIVVSATVTANKFPFPYTGRIVFDSDRTLQEFMQWLVDHPDTATDKGLAAIESWSVEIDGLLDPGTVTIIKPAVLVGPVTITNAKSTGETQ